MTECNIVFVQSQDGGSKTEIGVPKGTLISEAARLAGVEISQPCGGQGRCGRCLVQVVEGDIHRRSQMRLSSQDISLGYALACQTVVETDARIIIPTQQLHRRLTSDKPAVDIFIPEWYVPELNQTLQRLPLHLDPPSKSDQTDDWSRLQRAFRAEFNIPNIRASLGVLRKLGQTLRDSDWEVTTVIDTYAWDCPECPPRMVDLIPGIQPKFTPLWGLAIDIGTTTVSVWLVNLITGDVKAQAAEYNRQITRGEDVISRIVYASKGNGLTELSSLVTGTINDLIEKVCVQAKIKPTDIYKATIAGNSTMIHLLLQVSASSIRLEPFITALNHVPLFEAEDLGINICSSATVDCLPGVASYVGSDITAGVLSSGMYQSEKLTLFMDVGTNGEIVLGSSDWLVTCACSAGPAFEGAGVKDGMRATDGAIEEVWINRETLEPTIRVIGGGKPIGICGSGLLSLLAELFLSGVIDKAGNIRTHLPTPRVREGEHGDEYVVVWAKQSGHGQDIVITHVDIDNLLRAKAAIYAGYETLAQSVGISLDMVEQFLVGGSFGKYINVEKAIEIGLFPDMEWSKIKYLGNTAIYGAYLALLDKSSREQIRQIASRMTYVELSADNSFYEAFMSAMFLPHTNLDYFPSVQQKMEGIKREA